MYGAKIGAAMQLGHRKRIGQVMQSSLTNPLVDPLLARGGVVPRDSFQYRRRIVSANAVALNCALMTTLRPNAVRAGPW